MEDSNLSQEMVKTFQARMAKENKSSSDLKSLKSPPSNSSLYGTDVVVEEHRELVDKIARHVVYGKLK